MCYACLNLEVYSVECLLVQRTPGPTGQWTTVAGQLHDQQATVMLDEKIPSFMPQSKAQIQWADKSLNNFLCTMLM